jgi:hypothetical protein
MVALLALLLAACGSFGFKGSVETPTTKAEFSAAYTPLPPEQKAEVKKQVCKVCLALFAMREGLRATAAGAPTPQMRQLCQNEADAVSKQLQRCEDAQLITGSCPH